MESTDLPFLSSFKIFQRFHCFYYSRINEETFFLLNKNKHGTFSHFKGKLDELDPAILFSVGRKLIKISCGLFMRQNLMLFADDAISPENLRDMVQLCKPQLQTPQLSSSKLYQKFIEDAFEDMKPYQDESDEAYFFFEIPYIDVERFHNFSKDLPINLEVKYFSRDEIISNNSGLISEKLSKLFTKDLNTYVETYIEKNLVPRTIGRYAVLSIVTTPTNYRTLGLLGSYFKKHGEEWRCYRYPVQEPTEEEIVQFDGKIYFHTVFF